MIRGSFKWVLLGGLTATALSIGIFLKVPVSANLEEPTIKAEESDYSRSLYGVPVLEMNHYKIDSDSYLSYVLAGGLSVGRENPSGFAGWYSKLIDNPEILSTNDELKGKINLALGDSKFNELTKALEKAEEERKLKEAADKEEAERKAAELENEKNQEESEVQTPTQTVQVADYVKSFENEYNSFNKSVVTLEETFNESDWAEVKTKAEEFSVAFSEKLVKDVTAISKETNDDFVKNLSEVNSTFVKYISMYESKLVKKEKVDVTETKNKIDELITSLSKVLE